MNQIFSKLKDFVGINEPAQYDEYGYIDDGDDDDNLYPPVPSHPSSEDERRRRGRHIMIAGDAEIGTKMGNVIDMPGSVNGNYEVVLMEPRSFDEMPGAIEALRERKMVVLNLTMMEPDQAQRAVDFVAGGTYAMNGHQERVGESIFLFTPLCVQVTTQSGIVHEAPQTSPMRPGRVNAPNPAWTGETTRIAHTG